MLFILQVSILSEQKGNLNLSVPQDILNVIKTRSRLRVWVGIVHNKYLIVSWILYFLFFFMVL